MIRTLRRLVPLALVTVGALTGCTFVASGTGEPAPLSLPGGPPVDPLAPVPDHAAEPLQWTACDDDNPHGEQGMDTDIETSCATLTVPVDYADPTADTLDLALVRVHRISTVDPIPIVVNPGGPGASGNDLARSAPHWAADLLGFADVIGFDPRGVAASGGLECADPEPVDEALPPSAPSRDERKAGRESIKRLVDDCMSKYPDLEHVNTVETARDLDQIRQGLGQPQLTYLGFSYGTQLGLVYQRLFPDKVRALYLDAIADPERSDVADGELVSSSFQEALEQFAADCLADGGCPLGNDPLATVQQAVDQLETAPIELTDDYFGNDGYFTDDDLASSDLSAMYDPSSWEWLAESIQLLTAGDPSGFTGAHAGPDATPSGPANLIITCNDSVEMYTYGDIDEVTTELAEQFPLVGSINVGRHYACSQLPTRRHPMPSLAPAISPTLLVSSSYDPPTPYENAVDVAGRLGDQAVLVTYDGAGHVSYFRSPCVREIAHEYLQTLQLPIPGTTCQPDPE